MSGGTTDRVAGLTHRDADWAGLRVLVTGLGVSGFAAADALLERGAEVAVVDATDPAPGSVMSERARILDILGARLQHGPDAVSALPETPLDLVVTSPGWRPGPAAAGRGGRGRHPRVGRGGARLAAAAA